VLDIAVAQEIITKRGSFYSYGENRLAQGRENAKTFLAEHPEMALEIENQIRERFELPLKDPAALDSAESG
jgi:recombination protein RecA